MSIVFFGIFVNLKFIWERANGQRSALFFGFHKQVRNQKVHWSWKNSNQLFVQDLFACLFNRCNGLLTEETFLDYRKLEDTSNSFRQGSFCKFNTPGRVIVDFSRSGWSKTERVFSSGVRLTLVIPCHTSLQKLTRAKLGSLSPHIQKTY